MDRVQANISALEDLRKASAILLLSWLSTGLKRAVELEVKAMSTIGRGKIEQSAAGPDRASAAPFTRSIVTSRSISPEIFDVVAVQPITFSR
jgi:hypothetical protein